jgi:mono/diheme cytochrome c family protein
MPAFAERMKDADIAAVLPFTKSTWPADIRTKQARIDANARQRKP